MGETGWRTHHLCRNESRIQSLTPWSTGYSLLSYWGWQKAQHSPPWDLLFKVVDRTNSRHCCWGHGASCWETSKLCVPPCRLTPGGHTTTSTVLFFVLLVLRGHMEVRLWIGLWFHGKSAIFCLLASQGSAQFYAILTAQILAWRSFCHFSKS